MLTELVKSAKNIIEEAINKTERDKIYVSHSGGIDSTVVAHLASQMGITRTIFFNTGVEEKENVKFIKKTKTY